MAVSLHQKSLFSTNMYTLEYNGIRAQEKGFNRNAEIFIPFENIPPHRYFRRFFRRGAIIACMFFGVLDFFLIYAQIANFDTFPQPRGVIISILMIILPACVLWFSRREHVGYGLPASGVVFYADKPSRSAVNDFMEHTHTAKVAYLREVYLNYASDTSPTEVLRRLMWLKDMGVIMASEFDEQKQKIDRTSATTSNIGFRA